MLVGRRQLSAKFGKASTAVVLEAEDTFREGMGRGLESVRKKKDSCPVEAAKCSNVFT